MGMHYRIKGYGEQQVIDAVTARWDQRTAHARVIALLWYAEVEQEDLDRYGLIQIRQPIGRNLDDSFAARAQAQAIAPRADQAAYLLMVSRRQGG